MKRFWYLMTLISMAMSNKTPIANNSWITEAICYEITKLTIIIKWLSYYRHDRSSRFDFKTRTKSNHQLSVLYILVASLSRRRRRPIFVTTLLLPSKPHCTSYILHKMLTKSCATMFESATVCGAMYCLICWLHVAYMFWFCAECDYLLAGWRHVTSMLCLVSTTRQRMVDCVDAVGWNIWLVDDCRIVPKFCYCWVI